MADPNNPLIAALLPLVRRVRTDVTAIKKSDGSRWTSQPLTRERLAAHCNGGPARGVSFIKPGESVTMVALLDFDSHGGGETDWTGMSLAAGRVLDQLELVHGMSPLVSLLVEKGIVEGIAYPQTSVFEAAVGFCRAEGIIPAPESSHAIKGAMEEALKAKAEGKEKVILFNMSGHGLLDLAAYDSYFSGKLVDV